MTEPPDPTLASTPASEHLLSKSMEMLTPLVQLMIAEGVSYPRFIYALKDVFLAAAKAELHREGRKLTDAAISVRSGIHRKEVRTRSIDEGIPSDSKPLTRSALSLAEQVYTRWLTDARYRASNGRPAALPITGPAPSFESLATSITRDFSRRTVLDELVRLGLVQEDADRAIPLAENIVPKADLAEMISYYSVQLHDHLAAGAANVRAVSQGVTPPFLEQSLYANGLSDESLEWLSQLGRQIWKSTFDQMVGAATQRLAGDEAHGHRGRMRLGIYFYSEPDDPTPTATGPITP